MFATQGEKLGRDFANSETGSRHDLMRFFNELPPTGKIGFLYSVLGSEKAIQSLGMDNIQKHYVEAGLELGFDSEMLKNSKLRTQRGIYFRGLFHLMSKTQREAVLQKMKSQ